MSVSPHEDNRPPFEGTRIMPSAEVAALFGVDSKTVVRWANAGKITSFRTPGGHRRFRADEVHALIAGTTQQREVQQ